MSSPHRADAPPLLPGRRPSFVRDLGVTVVAFVALVGAVAGWLWIRDAANERGDRVAVAVDVASATPTAPAAPASTRTPPSSTDTGASTPSESDATAEPSGLGELSTRPAPRWVPVVEVLEPGTDQATAELRAMAVTALGFPATAMTSDQVDGIDVGTWVLVGSERATLDEALASCEARTLLATCQANTLAD